MLHVLQKGHASPAAEIALTYILTGLPHTAHLTDIELSLFSFFRNAESTPMLMTAYLLEIAGRSFVPVLCADDLDSVSRLSF